MKYVKKLVHSLRMQYYQRKCYKGIEDLPIVVWFKIHEGQGLHLLYKKENKKDNLFLKIIFEDIYKQFIKEIGLNKEYENYLIQLKHIGISNCECIINPSPINKVQLAMEKEKLKGFTSVNGVKYPDLIAQVSKNVGYPVWKVSVQEFYSYIKLNAGE